MGHRFWITLMVILFFGWGIYADYSIEIAHFFVGGPTSTIGDAGSWGDTFGAFNGLVSLAGAVFVVRTLMLQQISLKEQQRAIKLQFADAHKQRFEATFFELLKLLRELRSELKFSHSQDFIEAATTPSRKASRAKARHGTDALSGFILEHRANLRSKGVKAVTATRSELGGSYDDTMNTATERTFAPYFRLVYSILNRIRNDKVLSEEEKASYSRLVRSQLTNVELAALSYNALSVRAADLEDLLTEYRMLKYFPDSPARKLFEKIFDEQAFSARD